MGVKKFVTKKLLLVEDDPKDVELILAALKEHGLTDRVVVTGNGSEALDYLYRRAKFAGRSPDHPAAVFLDLKMPRIDGLEVLRQIKSDPTLKLIPVVVLTSSCQEQDVAKSYNLGVNAYIVKPVAFDRFVDVIKQLGLFWMLTNQVPPDTVSQE